MYYLASTLSTLSLASILYIDSVDSVDIVDSFDTVHFVYCVDVNSSFYFSITYKVLFLMLLYVPYLYKSIPFLITLPSLLR